MSTPNSDVNDLISNKMVFENGAFGRQLDLEDGALMVTCVCIKRGKNTRILFPCAHIQERSWECTVRNLLFVT